MTENELREQLEQEHALAFGWAIACCKGNRNEAEDVLQDSYLAILNGRARFDGRSSFRTWLFGVIRLTARAGRRKSWLRALLVQRRNGYADLSSNDAAGADIERESSDLHIQRLLSQLSSRQREVLHLVFYQELTIEEAAGVMGVSVGSARTHYTRGKDRLAGMLHATEEKEHVRR
jgi:RNA polymerase sigma factor (sigma-70 family)